MKTEKELAREIHSLLLKIIEDHSKMCSIRNDGPGGAGHIETLHKQKDHWGDHAPDDNKLLFTPPGQCQRCKDILSYSPVFRASPGHLTLQRGAIPSSSIGPLRVWTLELYHCVMRLTALGQDLEEDRPTIIFYGVKTRLDSVSL